MRKCNTTIALHPKSLLFLAINDVITGHPYLNDPIHFKLLLTFL